MKVLVTGATGFVGRALVPALVMAGHVVRAASREGTTTSGAHETGIERVTHASFVDDVDWGALTVGVDAVVHLAGIAHASGVDDATYDRVNHVATAALADAAKASGARRFVYMSSIKAQSGAATSDVLTEADAATPNDAYGRSKRAAELAVARSGVPFSVLRPVLVYGPGVKGNLRSLTRLADTPWPLPLGGLRNRRSLVAIENLIAAVELVMTEPRASSETFVLADPRPVTLPEIVGALRRGLGRPARLVPVPSALLRVPLQKLGKAAVWERIGGSLVVDPAKLLSIGWVPPVDPLDGLAALGRSAR